MVTRQLGVPVGLVSLVDATRQFFPGQVGLPDPWCDLRETPLSHSFCQHVVVSGEPLVIEDARTVPLVQHNLAIQDLGVIAYAGMPLTDGSGNVLGSLCAISDEPRAWTSADLMFLADLAATCSSEIRLRITARTAQQTAARLALQAEVGSAVVTTLDAHEVVSRLVRLVVPVLGDWAVAAVDGDAGVFATRHRDSAHQATLTGLMEEWAERPRSAIVSEVLRTGEPVVVGDRDDLWLDAKHVLVVPLRARTGSLGYLVLGRTEGPYEELEIRDAVDVGRRTGLALDNALLYRQQRDYAAALQQDLLTRMPEPDHLHLWPTYVPAVDAAQIGGDWYDAFLQPDGATVLVVGDVMGHDMQAAAVMAQLRNLVRGIAYDRGDSPAELLTRVDRALRGLDVELLATVLVARIEQTDAERAEGVRRLRWSSAGHPPPVLMTADGTVSTLETEGDLLLGIDPEAVRTDHEALLHPDSTLLLYTDGLVERRSSPLEHGLARLRQAMTGTADLPLPELSALLLERMVPDTAEDDVAMLAVRTFDQRRPRPPEAGVRYVPGDH
jgi:GAF domain-containing protein